MTKKRNSHKLFQDVKKGFFQWQILKSAQNVIRSADLDFLVKVLQRDVQILREIEEIVKNDPFRNASSYLEQVGESTLPPKTASRSKKKAEVGQRTFDNITIGLDELKQHALSRDGVDTNGISIPSLSTFKQPAFKQPAPETLQPAATPKPTEAPKPVGTPPPSPEQVRETVNTAVQNVLKQFNQNGISIPGLPTYPFRAFRDSFLEGLLGQPSTYPFGPAEAPPRPDYMNLPQAIAEQPQEKPAEPTVETPTPREEPPDFSGQEVTPDTVSDLPSMETREDQLGLQGTLLDQGGLQTVQPEAQEATVFEKEQPPLLSPETEEVGKQTITDMQKIQPPPRHFALDEALPWHLSDEEWDAVVNDIILVNDLLTQMQLAKTEEERAAIAEQIRANPRIAPILEALDFAKKVAEEGIDSVDPNDPTTRRHLMVLFRYAVITEALRAVMKDELKVEGKYVSVTVEAIAKFLQQRYDAISGKRPLNPSEIETILEGWGFEKKQPVKEQLQKAQPSQAQKILQDALNWFLNLNPLQKFTILLGLPLAIAGIAGLFFSGNSVTSLITTLLGISMIGGTFLLEDADSNKPIFQRKEPQTQTTMPEQTETLPEVPPEQLQTESIPEPPPKQTEKSSFLSFKFPPLESENRIPAMPTKRRVIILPPKRRIEPFKAEPRPLPPVEGLYKPFGIAPIPPVRYDEPLILQLLAARNPYYM